MSKTKTLNFINIVHREYNVPYTDNIVFISVTVGTSNYYSLIIYLNCDMFTYVINVLLTLYNFRNIFIALHCNMFTLCLSAVEHFLSGSAAL